MNMKYYNASNHFSAPIKREPKPYSPYQRRPEVIIPQKPQPPAAQNQDPARPESFGYRPEAKADIHSVHGDNAQGKRSLQNLNLNNLRADDLLLLGIIALLIWNSCDDTFLLLALGYLFFVGL